MTSQNKDDIIVEEIPSPSQENLKEDLKLKLVLLGDSGVGKTNLISRYIHNAFQQDTKATIGVEFFCKTFKVNNNKVVKIEIWDTAGQERYKSITAAYYKGAKGALIVYDTTQKTSFENIDKWMSEIKEKSSKDMKLMIIGNKIDLKDERQVETDEALAKAQILEAPIMETSALDATNVKEAFYDLLKEMYREIKKKIEVVESQAQGGKDGIQLETNEKKEKKGCC